MAVTDLPVVATRFSHGGCADRIAGLVLCSIKAAQDKNSTDSNGRWPFGKLAPERGDCTSRRRRDSGVRRRRLLRQSKRDDSAVIATGRTDPGAIAVRAFVLVGVERHVLASPKTSRALPAAATFRTSPTAQKNTFRHCWTPETNSILLTGTSAVKSWSPGIRRERSKSRWVIVLPNGSKCSWL